MKSFFAAIILLSTSICFGQQTNESVTIGSTNRTYVQYLPTGFDINTESLPVVIVLHGLGDNAANMTNAGFKQIGDTARFISLYPQGLLNAYGQTSWNNGTLLSSTADDVSFINYLINDAVINLNVDPSRIYVTGFSMGSIMSYHLACALNNSITAIGAMSGTMSDTDIANCNPAYATPVMHVHGTADGTVPYDGSKLPSLSLVPTTIDFWRNVHGCATTADSTRIPDVANDGLTVDRFVYDACSPVNSLELWRVNNGGHDFFYQPLNDFTESIDIWMFFRQLYNPNSDAGLDENIAHFVQISPNPVSTTLTINIDEADEFSLYSSLGEVVSTGSLIKGSNTINIKDIANGIYLLKLKNKLDFSERIVIQ